MEKAYNTQNGLFVGAHHLLFLVNKKTTGWDYLGVGAEDEHAQRRPL